MARSPPPDSSSAPRHLTARRSSRKVIILGVRRPVSPSIVINIVDEIRSAFPVGKPPARPITGHRCDECDEVDRLMGGRTWPDVADQFPQHCHDTFPLLTPEAKAYYLPA